MSVAAVPKVVHLTTVHQPYDVRILHKEAVSLAAAGFEVVLLAPASRDGLHKGVRIKGLPRSRNRYERMTRTLWLAFKAALRERAALYHLHDPELILAGFLLKLAGKRVVYDAHENVGLDIVTKPWLPGWLKPSVRAGVLVVEWLAARSFDRIVAATPGIGRQFPPAKTTLIRNLPLVEEFTPGSGRPFGDRARQAVYIGGLDAINGVEQMIRAVGALPPDPEVALVLGGRFPSPEAEGRARALPGAGRVRFLGWIDRREIPAHFHESRVGLVVYQPAPNNIDAEPNKFFEMLSAGLPIVASDFPLWRRFIEAWRCGLVVDPRDPLAIARAVGWLVDNPEAAAEMGANGRRAVETEYNWEQEALKLVSMYGDLLKDEALSAMNP